MTASQKNLASSFVKVDYRCDSLNPDGWCVCQKADGAYNLVDGTLYLCGSNYGEFQSRMSYMWDCDFDNLATVETRVKVENCEDIGGCGIFFGDGRKGELLTLYNGRVEFSLSQKSCQFKTTDDFHVYKIEISNGNINLSIDGRPALSSVLEEHPCRNQIAFGGFGSPGSGWCDYFKFEYHKKLPVTGGTVAFGDLRVVRVDSEALNFPFVQRFSDGTLWLEYSIGQHMTNESKKTLWSYDDGKIWAKPDGEIKTLETCQLSDGKIIFLECWNRELARKHLVTRYTWPSPASSTSQKDTVEMELPYPSALFLHRSVITIKDSRLLACGYGRNEKENLKNRIFCFESEDSGKTWRFLSEISEGSPGTSGFGEPCLLELADGNIICLMRTGGNLAEWDRQVDCGPLMQAKSADGGRTWSMPVKIANYGVDPHAVQLDDGTLVAASGRPGVYLLIDFTGTAENWQQMKIYEGPGSSYTTLIRKDAQQVLLFYDESEFCLNKGPGLLNRLMCLEMMIKKNGL